jgi:hypothetical protein
MAIVQALCTSFKRELLQGIHDFSQSGGDDFKIALYTSAATLGPATATYTTVGEVSGAGYAAGGKSLARLGPSSDGTTALIDFADLSWTDASFTARGALIYNATEGNRAVAVLDFGVDKTVSSGTFTIQFPAADAANAIIRIA